MISLKKILKYLHKIFMLPDIIEKNTDATEALLYFTLLKNIWPKGAERLLPQIDTSLWPIYDIDNNYIRYRQPRVVYKHVTLLLLNIIYGMTELSLQEKISIFESLLALKSDSSPFIYANYISYLSKYGFDDDYLLNICNKFESLGNNIFDKSCEFGWIYYLLLSIRFDNSQDTERILNIYISKYGKKNLFIFPTIAKFALSHNIYSKNIYRSTNFMNIIQKTNCENTLTTYLEKKTIAIVGSSSLECHHSRGEEIDSHDIVIRINHLPIKQYYKDFGQKTSILVCNSSDKIQYRIPHDTHFVIRIDGFERFPFSSSSISYLTKLTQNSDISLLFPSIKNIHTILSSTGYNQLSTGIMTIAYLINLGIHISKKNIFGFTHTLNTDIEQYGNLNRYHFYTQRHSEAYGNTLFHMHNLKNERRFLFNILQDIHKE